MKPHTEIIDPAVPSNCSETGLTEGKHCAICHEVLIARQEVPCAPVHHCQNDVCVHCGKTFILSGSELVHAPAGLKVVCSGAFANTAVTTVILPSGCKRIEKNAFENCTALRFIFIPADISYVDPLAFAGCSADLQIIYR